jgi:AGCS family alanine or glycine:cation symporter
LTYTETLERILAVAVDYAWGLPLIVLVVGGGLFLTFYSRFLPFLGLRHAIQLLRGKYDDPDDPGEISHFQALTTALSATVGVSNIAGVAIAITQGGPGAIFWMWVVAIVGMATKFFTCTLASMYRKRDENGVLQGGPMYYIEVGLGPRYRFLALFFSVCGLVGCLCLFQSNQLAEVLRVTYGVDPLVSGIGCAVLVLVFLLGGIKRIGGFTSRLVPAMCGLYVLSCLAVIVARWEMIPVVFAQIFEAAFTGTALIGGAEGIAVAQVIQIGVKRAAFSNEAGIGTAPMAHGAAKTKEPVREGMVAMIGPFVDTILVCSMTAFVILSTDMWHQGGLMGAALTTQAIEATLGTAGRHMVSISVILFGVSTIVGYAYYGRKCFTYLFGERRGIYYNVFYAVMLLNGAVWSVGAVVNLLDTALALMALPNMIATLLLAPRVMRATRDYLARHGLRDAPEKPSRLDLLETSDEPCLVKELV